MASNMELQAALKIQRAWRNYREQYLCDFCGKYSKPLRPSWPWLLCITCWRIEGIHVDDLIQTW